ncbi:MAG: PAS domain S-box protein [Candidatus Bathyarchaeota archaeon]|nr:PAS domain S-box protein [Candidatus Bathyarchaeota archaeon]
MKEKHLNRKLEDSFTALLSYIADPAVVMSASGQALAVNKATEKYTGIKCDKLVGKNLFKLGLFGKKTIQDIKRNLKKRLNGQNVPPYEVPLNINGKIAVLEINAKIIEHNGELVDVVVFRDVTEKVQQRKALENDLHKTKLNFEAISDSAFDGIIIFDTKQVIRYWNSAAQRIFGYTKNEVMGKKIQDTIIPPKAKKLLSELKTEFIKNPETFRRTREFPALKKDGTEFPTEISLSTLKIDKEELIVVTVRDITERKNAQHYLQQQRDIIEAVTKNTGVGLTLIDKNFKIILANEWMKEKTGKNITNKTCYKVLHKKRADVCSNCPVKKIFDGENIATKEDARLDPCGNLISAQITALPVRDKNGQIFAALEIVVPTTQRKLMEKKVKEAEELSRAMFEQTPLGVALVDPETQEFLQFNDVAHRQLGYSREEFSKLRLSDLEAKKDLREINRRIKTALRDGQTEFLTKHRTKNGEIRIVLVNKRAIQLSERKLLLLTCHDVTGINRMHDAVRSSEEKFHILANSVKDALVMVDHEGKITFWNLAAEKIFGFTSKEALGKVIHELVAPKSLCKEAKERIKQSMQVFGETGIGYFTVGTVEVNGRRSDGKEFPAELAIAPLKVGEKWHAVGLVKDISIRRIAEQQLKDAEQRYHALFDQSPLGVLVIDPETLGFVEFNDVAHLQLGYTREEFEKITIPDFQAEETPEQVRAHAKQMMAEGGGEFETKHRTKTGEIRDVIVTIKPFQSNGKTYLHCIYHDITEARKTQNALIESQSRYRQLIEIAQEGIWTVNNDMVTVFVNPRMAQMMGYSEKEMVGKSLFSFIDPAKAGKIRDVLNGYTRLDMRGTYEFVFPRKDGSYMDATVSLSVIADEQKRKAGILAVVSDISERKRAEKALKESEARFRAISTSAMDAIVLCDSTDKVMYWNPAAQKMFGYTSEEALGAKMMDLVIPPEFHKSHLKFLNQLSLTDTARRHFDLTALRKDGSKFPIDLSVSIVKLNGNLCFLSIVRDISEWKAMQQALRQERDMLESVAESTDMVLSIIGRDYKIIWANARALKITGCGSLENKYCYETFGAGSPTVCKGCGVKRVFENGEAVVRRDYYRRTKDNRDIWVELISTPIKDKDGNVIAALEIAVEITERKQLQNKLAEYSQRLEEIVQKRTDELKKTQAELVKSERLAAIGELASMIGHDLRNPLTGIKNSTYLLKKKIPQLPLEQTKEMLDIIDKCVNYSNKIINDLLDYSKEMALIKDEESPKRLLQDSLSMLDIPQKILVKNNLKDNPTIKVDRDKIKRVFINLIKNAVDAMPEGGKITVNSRELKDALEISISDTGPGIDEEIMPKLFTPLFTTKAQGMGFGLAICKRVVEAHNGTITVTTAKGKGTTFTLTFPIENKIENGGENVWIRIPESSLSTTTKP